MHELGLDLDLDMFRKISITVSGRGQICCGGPNKSGDQLVLWAIPSTLDSNENLNPTLDTVF